MSKRNLGGLALTLGVLAVLVSLAADRLGLGSSPGLGWAQISGGVVGLVLAAWGMSRLASD